MKNKKLIAIAVIIAAALSLMACSMIANVKSIDFTKAPKAVYSVNEVVDASQFEIAVEIEGAGTQTFKLNDAMLTVEGLVDGKLDTATPGTKTLKVTYMGVSVVVNYTVLGEGETLKSWADADVEGAGKDLYNLLNGATGEVKLDKDYDLAGYQWKPIANFNGTLDGNGYTISNLTITDKAMLNKEINAGLFSTFSGTVKNLKIENITIDIVNDTNKDAAKNYGCVVGYTSKSVNISNVTVENAFLRGNGRIGGIIGQTYAAATIENCNVTGKFIGNNPVTVVNADGEADKIGGIIGQALAGITINSCKVKVIINGTRDLGGIVGYVSTNSSFTNNTILEGSVITASVEGGMLASKGKRNAGGLIGTVAGGEQTITENAIEANVVIATNTIYADSSCGDFIGGFRSTSSFTLNGDATVYNSENNNIEAANTFLATSNTRA